MDLKLNDLKHLYIFEWLDEDTVISILKNSKIRSHKEWDRIIKEWDIWGQEAYIIVSWVVDVYIEDKFVKKLNKWNIFWEYALIRDENRTATVIADSDVTCIILHIDSLIQIASDDIKLNKIMISRINENIEKKLWIFKEFDF